MTNNKYLIAGLAAILILIGGYYFLSKNNYQAPGVAPISVAGNIVTYTDSGFVPASISIKVGEVVVFKNNSSGGMRVASNPHPVHTDLPGFDSNQVISSGESFSYTFVKVGSWGYHNHLNPSQGGTVVVQ